MIAVRALYREGGIEFLEPHPAFTQSPVIVIFLEGDAVEATTAPYAEWTEAIDWGEPMDEEGAQMLVALHEELAPYRAESNTVSLD